MREFGNVPLVVNVTRERWGGLHLEQLVQDLRYALRTLARDNGFLRHCEREQEPHPEAAELCISDQLSSPGAGLVVRGLSLLQWNSIEASCAPP